MITIEPDMDYESWAFVNGEQYMDEKGEALSQYQRVPFMIRPPRFRQDRSQQLQAYAQAVINKILM